MNNRKPALTIAEQIAQMQGRGLIFSKGIEQAGKTLANLNYYKLRAYTYPFQENAAGKDHLFLTAGITFEDIIDLYKFDRSLRLIIFSAIEPIELAFKSRLAYECMQERGPFFLNQKSFFEQKNGFVRTKGLLEKVFKESPENFISHHKQKYYSDRLPPAWVMIEITTFSAASRIYSNIKNSFAAKERIAEHFHLEIKELENFIKTLCITRNKCAHHARIWNKEHRVFIPGSWDRALYPREIDGRKVGGIYTILSAISHLLRQLPEPELADSFVLQVEDLIQAPIINKYPQTQYYKMGFPADWNTANPLWHKSRS